MDEAEPIGPYLEPVRKSVTVDRSIEDAFDVFTARIGSWWPKVRFSVSQERIEDVILEGHVGGELFEVRDDGERFIWGRVLVWDPPARVVFTWHPGRQPETGQEVEVGFVATKAGTRVELEHRGWERLGGEAERTREGYVSGWDVVFGGEFARACVEVKPGAEQAS